MNTLAHVIVPLVAVSLLFIGLLRPILIRLIDLSIQDGSRSKSSPVEEREPKPTHTLSAGGWPDLTLADQLPSPAGKPSADRHP